MQASAPSSPLRSPSSAAPAHWRAGATNVWPQGPLAGAQAGPCAPGALTQPPNTPPRLPTHAPALPHPHTPPQLYEPFFADFGPLNLGRAHRFVSILQQKLSEGERTRRRVYFCCSPHMHHRANAAVLVGGRGCLPAPRAPCACADVVGRAHVRAQRAPSALGEGGTAAAHPCRCLEGLPACLCAAMGVVGKRCHRPRCHRPRTREASPSPSSPSPPRPLPRPRHADRAVPGPGAGPGRGRRVPDHAGRLQAVRPLPRRLLRHAHLPPHRAALPQGESLAQGRVHARRNGAATAGDNCACVAPIRHTAPPA